MDPILNDSIRATIAGALDALLANTADGGLGKTCLIVYAPRFVPCQNCIIDPIGHKSSNHPRTGCPVPFTAGQSCSLCSGKGQIAQEQTEEVTFQVTWEPRKFFRPIHNVEVRLPHSLAQIKGFIEDLPKILKMDHIILNLPFAPYIRQKFRLLGEPGDPSSIVQNRYIHALLERWNG